jgi:site-specific DNA-cytosine methylase
LENAAGLISHDEGWTARTVQREVVRLGYAVSRRVLNAADFGSPQQRQRVLIVAIRVDVSQSETLPFLFPQGDAPFAAVADILQPRAARNGTVMAHVSRSDHRSAAAPNHSSNRSANHRSNTSTSASVMGTRSGQSSATVQVERSCIGGRPGNGQGWPSNASSCSEIVGPI